MEPKSKKKRVCFRATISELQSNVFSINIEIGSAIRTFNYNRDISQSYSAANAMCVYYLIFFLFSSKLINVLQTHIKNAINNRTPENELESFGSASEKSSEKLLYKTTKNLQYIMKFVIRSRILFAKLNEDREQDMFEASLEGA